ncbi:MAG: aminomethyl transferase family protein [Desulfomonile tiedjei]|nr:aminomethyl transferase family protein [Desulfomonile tiedjei]
MQAETRTTPLHSWHSARKATMGDFAGWNMPMWYPSGAVAEHRAVITHAGIFDTSHMEPILVNGPGSLDLLQHCFTRDLQACVGSGRTALKPGQCVYGAYLDERGGVIDDAIVYQFAEDSYMTVVNAGMGEIVAGHLRSHGEEFEARIATLPGAVGKMDLQGPLSAKILATVLRDPDRVLRDMGYFSFKGHFDHASAQADTTLADGTPILLSRTGYTGEFGFEIFVDARRVLDLWETILSAGRDFGLMACGLAARDSLRAGAVLPLSHQDIGPWPFINHPWSFALPFNKDQTSFTKRFMGDCVLEMRDTAEHTLPFVGYDPRKVLLHDRPVVLDRAGHEIGVVLTCVADMAIDRRGDRIVSMASPNAPDNFKPRGLSCGFIRVKMRREPGEVVVLRDSRRSIEVTIVEDIRPDRTARYPMNRMI